MDQTIVADSHPTSECIVNAWALLKWNLITLSDHALILSHGPRKIFSLWKYSVAKKRIYTIITNTTAHHNINSLRNFQVVVIYISTRSEMEWRIFNYMRKGLFFILSGIEPECQ